MEGTEADLRHEAWEEGTWESQAQVAGARGSPERSPKRVSPGTSTKPTQVMPALQLMQGWISRGMSER